MESAAGTVLRNICLTSLMEFNVLFLDAMQLLSLESSTITQKKVLATDNII